ncbi:ubiquitin carboxyl-terminal hydrolase [Colletotrichum truncatum]|uniref:Ubiquitin carboxyl-terminal hydrolase n=1 Tax=Colletotrichum truncatum TaxID=5467 RepID=A0ACC3Z698_COLTU|nr:ubiquitin carboxyl-terminal hydrolase [Colletotrichum truncatum]KAF6788118.1 ubiquitin carboxyl-terminal hydrolase [Colletotrichum truncatum]
MVATDGYGIMSPHGSPPTAQHWEGFSPLIKESMAGKSGRLAPRWVHDLLNSELDVGSFTNIQWDPNARCSRKTVTHTLVLVGNQSSAEGRNPGVLSCVCTTCDFHFLIRTAWDADQLVCLCQPFPVHFPPKDTDFYLHHLVNIEQPPQNQDYTSDYHPLIRESLIAVEHFGCSAPRCTFQVTVEISRPRLKREWVQLLTDQQRILDNLARARKQSPDRFSDARDDWCTSAPSTLNTYLRDLLDKPNPRNISQRNKRFQVVFGEECYVIFKAIEFSEEILDKDGVLEPYFIPPVLEPGTAGTPTRLSTLRAFVEDMQAEAESLIIRNGKPGENRPVAGNRVFKELQCLDYPQNKVSPRPVEAHRTLGVLPDFDKALIFYAYNRQSILCEQRRPDYVQALRDIAQETADDEFQTRAIQELTMVERMPTAGHYGAGDELEQQAYSFFSLQYTATDDAVIHAFNKKIEHSPSQADSAREMLQIIGRHRSNDRILNHASGPMDVAAAYRILEADPQWPDSTISMMCSVKLNKHPENKAVVAQAVEAMEAIAADRNSDELRQAAISLKADLSRMQQQSQDGQMFSVDAGSVQNDPKPRLDLPAGLENIGNTCYLNSILQYLRTVIPIRVLLAQYSEYQLGLEESDITNRLIGGNKLKVETAEAVIGRIFVEELDRLLDNLDNTKEIAIRPSQRLANAVLLPTSQIKKESNAVEAKEPEAQRTQEVMGAQFPIPPPLPARPAPGPPTKNVDHVEDVNMVNVSVNPVSESASSVSSQTLVSLPDADEEKSDVKLNSNKHEPAPELVPDNDVQMIDAETPILSVQQIEQRVLKALETQKRSSGTDQQDVEEVMGSIINRLQAAIRPTEISKDGVQWEPIMKTFYVELTNHTRMPSQTKFTPDSTLERAITAYPAETGPSTIHEGLSRNFDLQRVAVEKGEDIMRFTSIKNLPPILHVLIQRTKNDGHKNMNPVEVSEMLYLDRYMDTPGDPEFFKLRQKGWALQQRLEQLNSISRTTTEDLQIMDGFIKDFVCIEKSDFEPSLLADQPVSSLSFAGEEAPFKTYTPHSEPTFEKIEPPAAASVTPAAREQINNMREDEVKKYKAELDELFSQHKQQAYRLHAVICHSGRLTAGHYWVWIHDFEDGIWRKYNDGIVTENANTEEVLKTLNSNGDPYYLCYVKDEMRFDLVRVPKRVEATSGQAQKDTDGDIDLIDVAEARADGEGIPNETASDRNVVEHDSVPSQSNDRT